MSSSPTVKSSPAGFAAVAKLAASVRSVIRGKDDVIEAAIVATLAGGHLLLEDVPGVGKTTLARALAASLGGTFARVQFTSDLLPGDVIGVSVFDPEKSEFRFRPGPVFANVLLADEINRATPKTQSALLEAMAESSVTVDGKSHALPSPFLVVATQNPHDHAGTYPLPESQLDRFMLRLSVGYPTAEAEREILRDGQPEVRIASLVSVFEDGELQTLQDAVGQVEVHDDLVDYVQRLVAETRTAEGVVIGGSPRAALHLLRAARALAVVRGRMYLVPDDVKQLASSVIAHRLVVRGGQSARDIMTRLLAEVRVPQ